MRPRSPLLRQPSPHIGPHTKLEETRKLSENRRGGLPVGCVYQTTVYFLGLEQIIWQSHLRHASRNARLDSLVKDYVTRTPPMRDRPFVLCTLHTLQQHHTSALLTPRESVIGLRRSYIHIYIHGLCILAYLQAFVCRHRIRELLLRIICSQWDPAFSFIAYRGGGRSKVTSDVS